MNEYKTVIFERVIGTVWEEVHIWSLSLSRRGYKWCTPYRETARGKLDHSEIVKVYVDDSQYPTDAVNTEIGFHEQRITALERLKLRIMAVKWDDIPF